jgi:multiple sugar transport system ATP-binding protein
VDAPIDVVEPMGMETMLHFFVEGEPVCARVDPSMPVHHGETVTLAADLNQMHLIENDTGRVI